ncbi:GlsB/YeaQ/YmgE family stress response membrane protein [Streptacidiphilus carbonis]|uniref:GlsB/YeaQ/YmgE family stress response membrane protein n=1 Tax=Streptacidiphilus carbonis TaxID=105422 RepID=UPI000A450F8F|nr:GlsB/YeaQ/YmgE family stress response membrane protein [Streptacidiphilus carbonis]
MLWLIVLIIEGLIIGVLAKLVVPGRNPVPVWLTIVIGIAGALIGNWISNYAGVRHTSGIDWIRHLLQIGVAAVLVALATPTYGGRGRVRR